MIKPCPHCGETPEDIEWVDVADDIGPMDVVMDDDPPSMDLPETTECRRYQPCGHAFTTDSLETVVGELKQLRQLWRELKTTEDPERMKDLKEYIIPAQKNSVQNAKRDVERVEKAEELEL